MRTRIAGQHIAALIAALALVACNTRDRQAADTTSTARVDTTTNRVGAAADTAGRRVQTAAGSLVNSKWNDTTILAYTSEASRGEIRESELAARKATNPTVKTYARQLISDHRALMKELEGFQTKLAVKTDTSMDEVHDLMKHVNDDINDLTKKTAGADWDKEFIDHEINDHKDLLDKLQDVAKKTTSSDLRAALEKATGKVQEHLTKAQDIKDKTLNK